MSDKQDAKKMYENGCKYKDIHEKLGISINTVKSWRNRDKWQRKTGASATKKVAPINKKVAPKKVAKMINENADTNDRQKQFCLLYLQSFNATQAYQQAYNCSYETARTNGPGLLANTRIKQLIHKCHEEQGVDILATQNDAVNDMLKLSKAKVSDYIKVDVQKVIDPETLNADGKPHHYYTVQIIPRDINNMDTSLLKSLSSGRDGFKVELFDKTKILKEVIKYLPQGKTNAKADPVVKAIQKSAETGKENIDENEIDE